VVDLLQVVEGLAYVGFIAGAIFAVWELREVRRDRATQLMLSMMGAVSSRDMQEMVRPIEDSEYGSAQEAEERCGRVALYAVGGYFECLGYLVAQRMIDSKAVFEGLGIVDVWDKMKPWVLVERENHGPAQFENFEKAAELERTYFAKREEKRVWASEKTV
jgi:hypothetical protein